MYSLVSYVQGKSIVSYVYFTEAIHNFKNDQRGVTAVEYAIVAGGVGGVVAVAFGRDGTFITMLNNIFASLQKVVQDKILPSS